MFKTIELEGKLHLLYRTKKCWVRVRDEEPAQSKVLRDVDLSGLFGLEIVGDA